MRRKPLETLGRLQRAVLEIVWRRGEVTVQQARDALADQRDLAYTTILSVMQKLEKLGWLTHRSEGRTYVYSATRTREQAGVGSLSTLIENAFRGDPMQLFQHLIDDRDLSDDDLKQLRKMIDRKRKERGDDTVA
jgi:predicted transcriptional regulator